LKKTKNKEVKKLSLPALKEKQQSVLQSNDNIEPVTLVKKAGRRVSGAREEALEKKAIVRQSDEFGGS